MSQVYIDINLIRFIDFETSILIIISNGLLIVNQINKFNSEYIRANFSYQVKQELNRMQTTAE